MLSWRKIRKRKRNNPTFNNSPNSATIQIQNRTKKRRLNDPALLHTWVNIPPRPLPSQIKVSLIKVVANDYVQARIGSTCITVRLLNSSEGYVSMKNCDPVSTRRIVPSVENVEEALKIAEKVAIALQLFANRPSPLALASDGRVMAGNKAFNLDKYPGYTHAVHWTPQTVAMSTMPRIRYASESNMQSLHALTVGVGKLVDGLHRLRSLHLTNLYPLPNSLYYGNSWPEWRKTSVVRPGNVRFKTTRPQVTPVTLPIKVSRMGYMQAANLELKERLGKGGFGEVFLERVTPRHVAYMQSLAYRVPRMPEIHLSPLLGVNVAIKVQVIDTKKWLEDAIKESQMHAKLIKTGVVPELYASGYDMKNSSFVTFMEYVRGITLESWLSKHNDELPADLFVKIEDAVLTMWLAGYAHSDFNPKNVIINDSGRGRTITIIDFGWSTCLPQRLIPRSKREAYDRKYQQLLLAHLEGKYRQLGYDRGAPDPHVLRWLYQLVPDKERVQTLRQTMSV